MSLEEAATATPRAIRRTAHVKAQVTENLFASRPVLRQSRHQKNYIQQYPAEMVERMQLVGFRFLHQQSEGAWHCGWIDPYGEGFVCCVEHGSPFECFNGKCVWRIYQTLKFKIATLRGVRDVTRMKPYLDRVFKRGAHHPEEHLGMVVLPEGVSHKAWPAAWYDKREPHGVDNSDEYGLLWAYSRRT